SDIQRQFYKALVDAYEADKILLDTYGDMLTIKRPRDGADDDQEPFTGTDRGSKRRRSGKEPKSTSAPREKITKTAGKTTTSSRTHKQSASKSTPVCNLQMSLKHQHIRSLKQVSMMNNRKKRSILFLTGFNNLNDYLLLIMHGTSLYLPFMNLSNLG
ncbi:hypothetical protein Tco_0731336, partial [Tanacetum coccineum]